MKRLFLLSVSMLFTLFLSAQAVDLQKMSTKKRNHHLRNIAKEVTLAFAPEYYREYKAPIILGPYEYDANEFSYLENKNQFIGRKYYRVIIPYDFSKENLHRDYAAKIQIWADDGTPMTFFAAGQEVTMHFLCISFEQLKKEGITEEMMIPYVERKSHFSFLPTPEWDPKAKRSWEIMDEKYKNRSQTKDIIYN